MADVYLSPHRERQALRAGSRVEWDWGQGAASGKITERYTSSVTLTLKGAKVTRNATEAEPAYRIEQDDGDVVLKSESELRRVGD